MKLRYVTSTSREIVDTIHQAKKDKGIRYDVGRIDVHFSFGNVTFEMPWNIPVEKSGQR